MFAAQAPRPGILFAYGALSPHDIRAGLARLADGL